MKARVSKRFPLVAALCVALATVGVVGGSVAPTYASPSSGTPTALSAGDFHEVAWQGFGDYENSWAWSMEYYQNHLLVGTNRNFDCYMDAMIVNAVPLPSLSNILYPPKDSRVVCPSFPGANKPTLPALAPTLGGEIWSLDLSHTQPFSQSDWQEVYQSPLTVPITIANTIGYASVNAPRDTAFRGMSVFDDGNGTQSLYVSGIGIKPITKSSVPPPSLLRTTSGMSGTFQAVPADPGTTLGSINTLPTIPNKQGVGGCCIRGTTHMVGQDGQNHFLAVIGTMQGAGAVFSSTDPKDGNDHFVQITPPGMQVFEIAPYNGHLYLGVQSADQGYSVVWTDCLTPPPGEATCQDSDYHTVVPSGGGAGSSLGNFTITSMHVFTATETVSGTTVSTPYLYVGTDGAPSQKPAEIVRIHPDDTTWDLVVGSQRTYTLNGGICSGTLSSDGTQCTMTPISGLSEGFGWFFNWHMWRMEDYNGVLYVGTFDSSSNYLTSASQQAAYKDYIGFDLWASTDGVHFFSVTANGFGNPLDFGARTLKATPNDGLFLGTANYWQGLRIFQGSVPQSALQLAPRNVATDSVGRNGTVALSWDAPAGATLFHVYRATSTLQTAPPQAASPDPDVASPTGHLPRRIWLPGAFTEIGTSSTPYYVDQTAQHGGHYSYYVVAQDAAGHLSAPSNADVAPHLAPAATFRSAASQIAALARAGALTAAQAGALRGQLRIAFVRLLRSDGSGSQATLEQMRQQILGDATTPAAQASASALVSMLGRLEQRLTLVHAHVLAPRSVS